MEVGGELVKVEDLPHLHHDTPVSVPPELGQPEETVALLTGEVLVSTSGPSGSRGCLALLTDEQRLLTSACQADELYPNPRLPIDLRIGSFFAMSRLPPEVGVVERGGVFRRVENGIVYFDETVADTSTYYAIDGRELSIGIESS